MSDYTTVVAVDCDTVIDLRGVWPTWQLLKPELREHPLLVIFDAQAGVSRFWWRELRFLRSHPHVELIGWDWPNTDDSEFGGMDQRERMLSAFVKVPPAVVTTPYWLKIDCDVVATAPGPFVDPNWWGEYPALIGPAWGYTKPATLPGILDRWAATIESLAPLRAMNLPEPTADQETIATKRVCSWFMFVSTAFSKQVSELCPSRLPVPSQDTLHWYVAWRRGDNIIRHNFKHNGWQTVAGGRRRRKLIAEVMDKYSSKGG